MGHGFAVVQSECGQVTVAIGVWMNVVFCGALVLPMVGLERGQVMVTILIGVVLRSVGHFFCPWLGFSVAK